MDALKATLVKLVLRLCSLLPLEWARTLGRGGAAFYWLLGGRSRRVTERNVQLAFPELSEGEQARLARRSLAATGELIAEMGHVWLRSWGHAQSLILEVKGDDLIREAQTVRRGVIVLAPHLGNWEIVGLHLATLGNTVSLYEPPKLAVLGPVIDAARRRSGAMLVPADSRGVAKLLKSVRGGHISGILPDQVPVDVRSGRNAPFMGVSCFTATLASNMIRHTGALAVFGFAQRVAGGFCLHYLPAEQEIYDEEIDVSLAALNRGVETCLRHCAEQYQWEYKRFRVRPGDGAGFYDEL